MKTGAFTARQPCFLETGPSTTPPTPCFQKTGVSTAPPTPCSLETGSSTGRALLCSLETGPSEGTDDPLHPEQLRRPALHGTAPHEDMRLHGPPAHAPGNRPLHRTATALFPGNRPVRGAG